MMRPDEENQSFGEPITDPAELTQKDGQPSRFNSWKRRFKSSPQSQPEKVSNEKGNASIVPDGGVNTFSMDEQPQNLGEDRDEPTNEKDAALEDDNGAETGFTTPRFDGRKIPVEDFTIVGPRRLVISRIIVQAFILCGTFVFFLSGFWILLLILTIITWTAQAIDKRIQKTIVKRIWSVHRWPQWFLEYAIWDIPSEKDQEPAETQNSVDPQERVKSQKPVKPRKRRESRQDVLSWHQERVRFWWLLYFLVADSSDFHQNYMNAWISRDKSPRVLKVVLGRQYLDMPLPPDNVDDSVVFAWLNMFYRYLKLRKGVLEIIIPKELVRIDCVEIEQTLQVGRVIKVLDCGRRLRHFRDPMSARQEISVRDNLISLVEACPPSGLEFIRTMNQKAVAIVIMTPTVASVVAWILWISIHIGLAKIRDKDFDVQVIVTTGFTIAIYLVTAGGFIIALAGYLDSAYEKQEAAERTERMTELVQRRLKG